ncbi:hypothetical protein [Heterosigma akashiwo virus 01]|uniref:Uncharacterized protein n=1 Tax=Heterosigma akashiwo virus 01 TaxID=97195 RepID=A0A1C9C563_HAV01|nr:hypothetical protein D1R72_gp097 [Heterosigma akashiwo virus 01]AOM63428.1 hypothetical protein [Heterosigma akashiwo virus 01]
MEIVQWKIKKQDANKVLRTLIHNKYEEGGSLSFDDNYETNNVEITNIGNAMNVKTPDALVNFHTHPLISYQQNKAIFGHPSGEDMRECIRFAMVGNSCHIVFTLEGIYTIQVQPKIITIFSGMKDEERSFIIHIIELYFKQFHKYRTIYYYQRKTKKKCTLKDYNPFIFVDKCNLFTMNELVNFVKKHKINNIDEVYTINSYGKTNKKIMNFGNVKGKLTKIINDYKLANERLFFMIYYVADNMYDLNLNTPEKRWRSIRKNQINPYYSDDDITFKFIKIDQNKKNKEKEALKSIMEHFKSK